jgi:predicted Zn-ribbon and HTH transcriptional regulator
MRDYERLLTFSLVQEEGLYALLGGKAHRNLKWEVRENSRLHKKEQEIETSKIGDDAVCQNCNTEFFVPEQLEDVSCPNCLSEKVFHEDVLDEVTKTYKIGRPNFLFIVEDSQLVTARDDFGMAVHRAQALGWRRRKVNMTITGLSDEQPMKVDEDTADSIRMVFAERMLDSTPFDIHQAVENRMPDGLKLPSMEDKKGQEDYGGILLKRQMAVQYLLQQEEDKRKRVIDVLTRSLAVDPEYIKRNREKRRRQ